MQQFYIIQKLCILILSQFYTMKNMCYVDFIAILHNKKVVQASFAMILL